MTYEKVLALSTQLDMMQVPKEGRILALHPYHATDLQLQDLEMFKTFFSTGSYVRFQNPRSLPWYLIQRYYG